MKVLAPAVAASLALFLAGCSSSSPITHPTPATYIVSGSVADLSGSGLVLQDNGGDNLTVTANGTFQFATKVGLGFPYSVTVLTQPSNPAQQCTVANGAGTEPNLTTGITVECGHNEWAWMTGSQSLNQISTYGTIGMPATTNTPGGRQYPATWTDTSGNLWLFGGYGHDLDNTLEPLSDLWEWSAGEWTWVEGSALAGQNGFYGSLGVADSTNIPGARFQPASWTDGSGNFWLFGGNGFDSVGNESPMNDLWEYSAGQWTWVGGSNVGKQNGHYGTLGVADSTNLPGGRCSAAVWKDSSGDIWVFGGLGYDASNPINGDLNDFWKYSGGQWTWMGGSTIQSQKGVFGTQGTANSANVPSAREAAYTWIDSTGTLWLFGGYGYDSNGANGYLNDLWTYSSGKWMWVGGSNVVNHRGVYGTQGVADFGNIPGARWSGMAWMDASGNAWLFGGSAYTPSNAGFVNDLWKYSGGEWTWVSGSNSANPNPTYGTEGTLFPGNTPGGRFFLNGWVDPKGNLWLFGGYGQEAGSLGNLNDLWMYIP